MVALLEWKPQFEVGYPKIDQQHQQLFDLINAFNDCLRENRGRDVIDSVITRLVSYAKIHFQTEEKIFPKVDMPQDMIDAHVAEHKRFVMKLPVFIKEHLGGKAGLELEIINFLGDWIVDHVTGMDSQYAPYFQAYGRAHPDEAAALAPGEN